MSEEPKKIEVVAGDGTDLEISEVSTHITTLKPKIKDENDKKQEVVIPQVKKNCCKKSKK